MSNGIVTGLEVQKRNKKRVNVYIDDDYAFSLALDEAVKLHKGEALSQANIDALRGEDDVLRAVDTAAHFLGHRPRSEAEVRRNLEQKEMAAQVIDEAMERLRKLGYLDDHAFAAFWVKDRTTFKPAGPRALRYELRQKGVADAVIADVLAEVDVDDAALRAARAQVRRVRAVGKREFTTKMSAFLQRRGFTYEDIRNAIRLLIEELETEDPDYFAGTSDSADDTTWAGK